MASAVCEEKNEAEHASNDSSSKVVEVSVTADIKAATRKTKSKRRRFGKRNVKSRGEYSHSRFY